MKRNVRVYYMTYINFSPHLEKRPPVYFHIQKYYILCFNIINNPDTNLRNKKRKILSK